MFHTRLNQFKSSNYVGVYKRPWRFQRIVVVAFGSKVNDNVSFGNQRINNSCIADVAFNEFILTLETVKVGKSSGIGEGI